MQRRHAFGSLSVASTLSLSLALCLVPVAPAAAQWVWKDDAGHIVASDQPPPTSVPRSRIVREPRTRPTGPMPILDKDANRAELPKSGPDKDLDAKQRQKDAADAAKKADDEAVKAKAMQENCTAVRSNLAALQAGGRAARFDEKGERVYLDDAQRASEIQKSQGQIAQYCR